MLRKIFKKVINLKILFKLPENIDLVIFDNVGLKDLKKNLLKDLNYFVLKTRYYEIDEVYLSLKLFKKITKNFKYFFTKNFSIQDIYFLVLTEY